MKQMRYLIFLFILTFVPAHVKAQKTVWLDKLNLTYMESFGPSQANQSYSGKPLCVAGKTYERGVGTHAESRFLLDLGRKALRFSAWVGLDDHSSTNPKYGSVEFIIFGDRKILWQSGVMHKGDPAQKIDLDLNGIKLLGLMVTDAKNNNAYDHADWLEAKIETTGKVEPLDRRFIKPQTASYILTPKPSDEPRINGAKVFGVRPGNPFLYTIPATGAKPIRFSASHLPEGLSLDPNTGQIRGVISKPGTYNVVLAAINHLGSASQDFRIEAGDQICLTPPMGWNSWNCWGGEISAEKVMDAALIMKEKLSGHGWTYINIDDGWEAEKRDSCGILGGNEKFPDFKSLCDNVHSLGLKVGIYSSPGPTTCVGHLGSYQHEEQDAITWADWGIDYLKYDRCSYQWLEANKSTEESQKPYRLMREALNKVNRDIVYSLCQYGINEVWKWGGEVGGNLWRTTGDIGDTWFSLNKNGFSQAPYCRYIKPGNWNDPDMLIVGKLGWSSNIRNTRLTPDEQYTHISLWCLQSAPLLIGCDLSQLDDFTLNLLTNDEVLAVDQDPAAKTAVRIETDGGDIWYKPLEDGSIAVGFFYKGFDYDILWTRKEMKQKCQQRLNMLLSMNELGIKGKFRVRDLWRQQDLGVFRNKYEAEVPYHGVVFVKITPEK